MEFEILNNEITSINYIILLFKELTDLKISLIEHVKNIEVSLINDGPVTICLDTDQF